MKAIKLLLVSSLLLSCSSLSEKDCKSMDWHTKAIQDVQKNKNWLAQLNDYKQTCSKHDSSVDEKRYIEGVKHQGAIKCTGFKNFHVSGWAGVGRSDAKNGREKKSYYANCSKFKVSPAKNLYNSGYANGLANFCTKKSGYNFGIAGGKYKNTCSHSNENAFLAGYESGQDFHKLNKLEDNLRAAKSDQKVILDNIELKEQELAETQNKMTHYIASREGYIKGLEDNLYSLERSKSTVRIIGATKTSTTSSNNDEILKMVRKIKYARKDFEKKRSDYLADIADIERELSILEKSARDNEDRINDLTIEVNNAKKQVIS